MEYRTVREAAKKWDLSIRMMQPLCARGRILGAERFRRSWAVHDTAEKPTAPRKGKKGGAERVTDEEYYRRYLGGDETGLTALMDRYGDALTLYIDGYLGDIHEAEDLMIETFSYLLTKRPRIRDGGLKAYLYKSARHMALRHKSKWRAVFSLEELAEEPEAETLIEEVVKDRERSRILHLCMERLHAEYREVLYLTYFEGLSYAEAAEVMGKSVKQITNMVYRGKQSLRELLEKEGITHAE